MVAASLAAIGNAPLWAVQRAMLPRMSSATARAISNDKPTIRVIGRASRLGSLFIQAPVRGVCRVRAQKPRKKTDAWAASGSPSVLFASTNGTWRYRQAFVLAQL